LPPFVFLALSLPYLLRTAEPLKNHLVVVIVLIVEIEVEGIPDPSRDTPPGALPLIRPRPLPCTTHPGLRSREVVEALLCILIVVQRTGRVWVLDTEGHDTFHAEPRSERD
jgi:hypothetical protein